MSNPISVFLHPLEEISTHFRSENLDERKSWLLKISLFGVTTLSAILTIIVIIVRMIEGQSYNGVPLIVPILITLLFSLLWKINNQENYRHISILLMSILSLCGYGLSLFWGVDVPQSLLIYALSLFICGMLFGSKEIFALFIIHSLFLTTLSILQANQVITYSNGWNQELVQFADGLAISTMLFLITLVIFVFSKQVELADLEARRITAQLLLERDLLEKEVLHRTQQLRSAHLDRIFQLYRLAELGKSSAGMLHDIAQPVTAAFLALHDINQTSQPKTIKHQLSITNQALTRIETYIVAARRQVNQHSNKENIRLKKIIEQNVLFFEHQLRSNKINLTINCHTLLRYSVDPTYLSPILCNLITNAIDCCNASDTEQKNIKINVRKLRGTIEIDISDSGCGIRPECISHIFEPFYSTKNPNRGIGLGLSQVYNLVTDVLGGSINVKSKINHGATFQITLPI